MHKSIAALFLAATTAAAMPATTNGQIFVANAVGTIGEYTTSGATVNATLVTGLTDEPNGVVVSGGNLFVENETHNGTRFSGSVGEYDATTGAAVNASLITGLDVPQSIAVSGADLFVATYGGTIGEYTTSGATVNASLVTGLNSGDEIAIALYGNDLFVLRFGTVPGTGSIGVYDATTGATVNASLITGLNGPTALAISGGNLFETNYQGAPTIGEYTTSGATVNASLITGLDGNLGIAVSGGDLFVTSPFTDSIGEYTTSGATVNASLITGLNTNPIGIFVAGNVTPGLNQTVANGGGPTTVGGVGATLPTVTSGGNLTSDYQTVTTLAGLESLIGSAAFSSINFAVVGNAAQLWDLHFDGSFTGLATVTLSYDPTLLGSVLPSSLYIEHYTGGQWVDLHGVVEASAHTITFQTDSFSPFVLAGVPEPSTIVLGLFAAAGIGGVLIRKRRVT